MPSDLRLLRALDTEAEEELEEAEEIEEEISSPYRWTQGIILLLGALGIQRMATLAPETVERVYSQTAYPIISRFVSIVNRPFSFSFAEVGLLFLLLVIFIWVLWLLQKVWNGFLSPLDFIAYIIYRAIWVGGAVFLLFLLLWGFNYHRQPLATTLGLQGRATAPGELETICGLIISRMNANHELARARSSWGTDSHLPLTRAQLFQTLEESYQNLELLGRARLGGYGPPKPMMFSPWVSRFGVTGIFTPFTGEANYNEEAPACDLPFIIAHEKAHQRGFAREDEANFIGFLACINANDPFVRYSGYLQAMPRVMDVLYSTNADEYNALLARIGQGPRADVQGRAAFWNTREDRMLSAVARGANNTYLRANRIRSGIANYNEVTALIINYFLVYPNGGRERPLAPVATGPAGAVSPTPLASPLPTPQVFASPLAAPTERKIADPGGFIP